MTPWLFDLGNTRLKYAPAQGSRAGAVHIWSHREEAAPLPPVEHLPGGEVAWVASVAGPALCDQLRLRLEARFEHVHIAASLPHCGRLVSGYADPSRLGVDRFLALLACSEQERAALVVGVGTALTVDLLGADGRHQGGLIAPSPTVMRQSLHHRAAHLPAEGGQARDFADNTLDALAGGAIGAALGLVERCIEKGRQKLGQPITLILHGGGADVLLPHLEGVQLKPRLVLDGLAMLALHNSTGEY